MVNQQLAEIFNNMAAYLSMNDDQKSFFRARAFRKAAEIVDKFPHDLGSSEWYKDIEKMKKIEGIGERIAKHINEYVDRGVITEYEQLKKKSPVKLEELMKIQGIGPKKILKLYKKLGIKDTKTLKRAAKEGEIAKLDGFGKKSQDSILENIEFAILSKDRVLINVAESESEAVIEYMKKDKNVIRIESTGSLRRKRETIGDLDILIASSNHDTTIKHFVNYPNTEKILAEGETRASIWLKSKIQCDLRILDKSTFGAAMQYFTGNKEHNVKLRGIAIKKDMKLSEYGLVKKDTEEVVEAKDEKKIYEVLVKNYIEPELRENEGEIEAAIKGKLPNLIELKDIKQDIHMHTNWSDGASTIKEMAVECKKIGYTQIGISDHFGKLAIAGAISEKKFEHYLAEIRKTKVNDIKILAGGEVDIAKDGSLEFNEDKLKELDYVIASAHLSNKISKDEMTKRLIKALQNKLVKVLAHPTGRLLNKRPGFTFDFEEVFKVAKNEDVALEINAHPMRLDLDSSLVRLAKKIGCKISINTDAHSIKHLYYMKYGVNVGRRGWLEPNDLHIF